MIVLGSAVLSISLLLQLIAACLAWRLIRVTKRHLAWILMVMAFFLMEIRRCIPLFRIILRGGSPPPDLVAELVALITSALLVAGIAWITPFFLSIKHSEEKMQETWEWFFTTLSFIRYSTPQQTGRMFPYLLPIRKILNKECGYKQKGFSE